MTYPAARRMAVALAIASIFTPGFSHADAAIDAVFVTASRAPQAASDVIADHIVLDADAIARSGAANIVDLLQQQRAVEVSRNGGPGANASVYLRGADAKQNVVLVDGVRVGSSSTGAATWSTLPLSNVERIEIVYGPLATLYGADAIGGVVQIFTRRGAGPARVFGQVGGGSLGARAAEVALAGATDGAYPVDYAFSLARDKDTGFSSLRPGSSLYNSDTDGYDRDSASARLNVHVSEQLQAGVVYLHSHLNAQYDSGASSFDTRTVKNLDNIAIHGRYQVSPGWNVQVQAAESSDESTDITSASASGINRIETRQNIYTLQSDLALGPDLLQLIAERRVEEVVSNTSAALTRSRATNALAAAYSVKRGAHLASASVRADDSSQYGSKVTGGIGYAYRISPALRANASAGTSFRAPTFNELYFAGFGVSSNRPERGRNVEAGLHYQGAAASAGISVFRNRLTDLLVNLGKCPVEVATHPTGCAYNVNRATLRGVSVDGATRLGQFELQASLDWQDPRDDTTGKQLPRRARRHGVVRADYHDGPYSVGMSVVASTRRFDDSANRNLLAGYGLVNLHASYEVTRDWSILARWNNATDKQYELARNYNTAGSTLYAGLRYGFN